MSRSREHDGVAFRREESRVWWIRYRDRDGIRRQESTQTEDSLYNQGAFPVGA